MDYNLVWTETAQKDLKQLVAYIAVDAPMAAKRFVSGHVDQTVRGVKDLGDFPS
ncbi:MAG: type II toxin-antitoxin system RelE/ParE family toxin [Verrucomicrobiae bacterium]|nr:type II toxin-antitoxin system RelE/ParE family toxin [Verrucomicrobiae bacterium]